MATKPHTCKRASLEERFWDKVSPEPNSGCWLWTGAITRATGYGYIQAFGKVQIAHRVSYLMHVGPIPNGLHIDHLCRVRGCVNPDHLEPVTIAENLRRGISFSARNSRKTHCPNGHPFSGDNLYLKPDGERRCRECNRQSDRLRYARLTAA